MFSLVGTILLIFGDSQGSENISIDKNAIFGDALLILGSFLYCLDSIYIEYVIKRYTYNFCEFMSMTSMCSFLYSAVFAFLFEDIKQYAFPDVKVSLLRITNTFLMVMFYSLVPIIIKWSGSAIFNISLLTSNLWTMISQYILFGGFQHNTIYYFISALILIIVGVSVYFKSGDPYIEKEYRRLDDQQPELEMTSSSESRDEVITEVEAC